MNCVGLVLTTTLTLLGSTAVAQEPQFVERPGKTEFTGKMTARPLQAPDAATPVERAEARWHHREALAALGNFQILEHKAQTDIVLFRLGVGETENAVARQLMATGHFDWVEPDWRVFPIGCPNDSQFGNQWHHNSNLMDSCDAWDIETGTSNIAVAICDTGIRTTHEDFLANRLEGYNAVDRLWESQGGDIGPIHPHGTMTSGCAAANGNNGVGVSGVGQNLSHRMVRVSNRSDGSAGLSDVRHGAQLAIETGDKVASVSYSGVNSEANRVSAEYIWSLGGLLVWAAGNEGNNLDWGNRDNDKLIVAGATTSSDGKPSWSNYGISVDVMAPGSSVYTTDSGSDSDYANVSGTSFSCPLTAGLCALLFSADPNLTPAQVELCLKLGCDDIGATGPDNTYAYGRIDSEASLQAIQNVKPTAGILMSMKTDGSVGGVSFDDDDVLLLDQDPETWSMYFDASDVLDTTANDLSGVCELDDGTLLLTFAATLDIPGMTGGPNGGELTGHDIVQFTPTSTGENTAGSFAFYFDGSDVGVNTSKENLRGLAFNGGDLYVTTQGALNFSGVSGKNEDYLEFSGTLGADTSGSWTISFDGNDSIVRLGKQGEQLDAIHVSVMNGNLMFSTGGDFKVPVKKTGDNNDLLIYRSDNASGMEGRIFVMLRGEDVGLAGLDIDGLHIRD